MEIGVFEAKNRLSALIAEVARGNEVTITSRGKPVARLVAASGANEAQKARARAAIERIRVRARGFAGSFDPDEWKAYRDEARR